MEEVNVNVDGEMDEEEPHTEKVVKPMDVGSSSTLNKDNSQGTGTIPANVKSIESSLPGNTLEATIEKKTIEKKGD